jgi:Zn-dependent peptidase ImmA (M78 family)
MINGKINNVDTSILPPSQKGRHYEIRAIGLRQFAGLRRDDERLNPFDLAIYANLLVVNFEELESSLSDETIRELIGNGKEAWSGGACSKALPNGKKLIILNPTHHINRQHATLMEEISHVFLGHKPSQLAKGDKNRDYNAEIEEEAYSVGVAALTPYTALRRMVNQRKTTKEMARHFKVSQMLIEFRLKITRLWEAYTNG